VSSTDIRGAFKLSQQDSTESKTNVVAALRERGADDERAIAELMAASLR
jgi:predicted FMN-binding regulatory protein PaiB